MPSHRGPPLSSICNDSLEIKREADKLAPLASSRAFLESCNPAVSTATEEEIFTIALRFMGSGPDAGFFSRQSDAAYHWDVEEHRPTIVKHMARVMMSQRQYDIERLHRAHKPCQSPDCERSECAPARTSTCGSERPPMRRSAYNASSYRETSFSYGDDSSYEPDSSAHYPTASLETGSIHDSTPPPKRLRTSMQRPDSTIDVEPLTTAPTRAVNSPELGAHFPESRAGRTQVARVPVVLVDEPLPRSPIPGEGTHMDFDRERFGFRSTREKARILDAVLAGLAEKINERVMATLPDNIDAVELRWALESAYSFCVKRSLYEHGAKPCKGMACPN